MLSPGLDKAYRKGMVIAYVIHDLKKEEKKRGKKQKLGLSCEITFSKQSHYPIIMSTKPAIF